MSDFEERKKVLDESEETVKYLRSAFQRIPQDNYFQVAVLRSLAVIIKLLVWSVTKG